METLNAQIKQTKLGFTNGILTFHIVLDIQDGGAVCVGGYAMDQYDKLKERRIGSVYGTSVIMRILEVVSVDTWEELKGKYIRIKDCHLGDNVTSIGNLMKNEWVNFETFGKED